jgi:hypothetical protein
MHPKGIMVIYTLGIAYECRGQYWVPIWVLTWISKNISPKSGNPIHKVGSPRPAHLDFYSPEKTRRRGV